MKTPKLTDAEVSDALKSLPSWAVKNSSLCKTFVFAGFTQAIDFVNKVAEAAERADHHPDIDVRYNKVTLALTTHDSGGLTENDAALAREADSLF